MLPFIADKQLFILWRLVVFILKDSMAEKLILRFETDPMKSELKLLQSSMKASKTVKAVKTYLGYI